MTVLIFTFANAIHFHLYGMPIGPYVFTVIKETYFTESIEFIEQYFRHYNHFDHPLRDSPYFSVSQNRAEEYKTKLEVINFLLFYFLLLFSALLQLETVWIRFYNGIIYSFFVYSLQETANEQAILKKNYIGLQNNIPQDITCDAPENQLIVVVIGESSDKNHYSLYGYPRKTTPLLEDMADELFVFQDVISHMRTPPPLYIKLWHFTVIRKRTTAVQ